MLLNAVSELLLTRGSLDPSTWRERSELFTIVRRLIRAVFEIYVFFNFTVCLHLSKGGLVRC